MRLQCAESFPSQSNSLTRALNLLVTKCCWFCLLFISGAQRFAASSVPVSVLGGLSAEFFNPLQLDLIITEGVSAGVCDSALDSLVFLASVCKGAKADVVFLIDGSWSIGEESFTKVVHFVSGMIAAFDVIGPSGMQVSFVQYSDEAKTEFKLSSYQDKGIAMSALYHIRYRGGNTKTGLISHTVTTNRWSSSCFSPASRVGRSGAQTHL